MLVQLKERVRELDVLADEVLLLAERLSKMDRGAQPDLAIKGQQWVRGARALMEAQHYSGLKEFDASYESHNNPNARQYLVADVIEHGAQSNLPYCFGTFRRDLLAMRALLHALESELESRELPVKTALSLDVASSEIETAQQLLDDAKGAEVFLRAAGVIARIALERHLFTVADSRSLPIIKNPPNKRHPDVEDVLQTLQKNSLITAIQKSQFDSLFKIANNCAHPKEAVVATDVERLIRDGKQLAALIV
jgi:inorganic triphosphatase YgiF